MSEKKQWKIFRPFGNSVDNVHIDWLEEYTPSAMAEGFKEAADATIALLEDNPRHPDCYFYPVAFLYRHCIELQLKNIIDDGQKLTPTPNSVTKAFGHKISELWDDAIAVFDIVFPDDDRSVLDRAALIIKELDLADPDGQSFRYYRNRNGEVNLTNLPRVFSLEQLQSEMHNLIEFLQGCAYGVNGAVEYQREGQQSNM